MEKKRKKLTGILLKFCRGAVGKREKGCAQNPVAEWTYQEKSQSVDPEYL